MYYDVAMYDNGTMYNESTVSDNGTVYQIYLIESVKWKGQDRKTAQCTTVAWCDGGRYVV
jgi:hypothetical protein